MSDKLSELAEDIELVETTPEEVLSSLTDGLGGISETQKLRSKTLQPLVAFYILFNTVLYLAVFFFAFNERYHRWFGEHIVTEKVIIALITGSTVQVAAMIIAAFKGLFDTQADSDPDVDDGAKKA